MIIEIESYKEHEDGVFLTGKQCSVKDLRKMVNVIFENSEQDFIPLFCRRYMYDITDNYKGYPDFVVDLDTHYVYCPHY